MLYSGTFSCGHEGKVNIIGKAKDREWKIERAFSNRSNRKCAYCRYMCSRHLR